MNWYCLHTKPLKEPQVDAYCRENLVLETYLPRLRQYRTIRRQRRLVTTPLFPRYLFVRFDEATLYRAVRYAPEVINIVHTGGRPAKVNEDLIGELRAWANGRAEINIATPLRPGDAVQLVDGPMQGLSAVILRASDDRERVTVLLSFLECSAQVTVGRSQVERLASVA